MIMSVRFVGRKPESYPRIITTNMAKGNNAQQGREKKKPKQDKKKLPQ